MSVMSSVRRITSTGLIGLFLATGAVAVTASPAEAAAKTTAKPCKATMSVTNPKQYTTTTVNVSKVGSRATVTTRAKYKTRTNTKKATASTKGTASVKYPIAGATPGRKVVVEVTAVSGKTTWKCATSFTPRKR